MSSPKVTVGLPFVKDANLLADAIRSVFAQTLSDWELILVDDGATEDCLSVAQSIQDPRVRVVRDDLGNRGLAFRLNQITQLARGDYIARMDADDLMHPERLQRQVQYLDRHPDVDVVGSDTYIINNHNQALRKRTSLWMGASLASVLKGRHVLHATVVARSSWFRKYPYNTNIPRTEDRELWCRTCTTSVFGHLPELLYFYRQDNVNVQNYINSYRSNHKLFWCYGPSSLGLVSTAYRILLLRLKIFAYRVFGFVNAQSVLAHWHSEPLLPHESLSAAQIIHNILLTPLKEIAASAGQKEMSRC
jgi:glycosyltransferase involved in cell wall biosynthesis